MAQFLAPVINDQQIDANGDPLSGGKIFVYLAGSSTPVTTYSDKAGLVPNTNPLNLNTLGVSSQGAVWLTGGVAYKYVIQNAALVTQRTLDNISGIGDTAVTTDQWLVYAGTPTYVSATSFTVAGDQTQIFQVGRRIKTTNTGGTVYSTITNSVYGAPNTTVTVANDSGALDSGLSAVSYAVLSVLQTSLPGGLPAYGQCRLAKPGANLVLSPYGGNKLTVNGQICTVPSSGVSLAPTSLTPGTLYYIYAYIAAAGLALEASTTGHATDTASGVEIKTGDASRTLVGMARAIVGPSWSDTTAQRLVISWFNRRPMLMSYSSGVDSNSSSGSIAQINTYLLLEFLCWGDAAVSSWAAFPIAHSAGNGVVQTGIGLDTSGLSNATSIHVWQAYGAGANGFANPQGTVLPPEGYHYFSPVGATSGATATWKLGGTFFASVWV